MTRKYKSIAFNVTLAGCHVCTSHARQNKGYPVVVRNGKFMTLVRWLYQQKHGLLQSSIVLRHKCDNRQCINLEHIEQGSHVDNMRDKVERRRQACGESHGFAKLMEKDVREIRCSNEPLRVLSRRYQITIGAVSHIKTRRTWKHIR